MCERMFYYGRDVDLMSREELISALVKTSIENRKLTDALTNERIRNVELIAARPRKSRSIFEWMFGAKP